MTTNKNKPYIKERHIPTSRSRVLSECDIYTSIYDNDEDMKSVKENFDRQTSQRFEEYEERMNEKRQKCREQCDKEIQKIILKDKLEKELMDKFATLQTDIQNDAIPTCVCEKSLADKTEKFCLNCGVQLGGGVLQASGLLGGIGQLGLDAWKAAALVTAKELAAEAGAAAGIKAADIAGANVLVEVIKLAFRIDISGSGSLGSFIKGKTYTQTALISEFINSQYKTKCFSLSVAAEADQPFCSIIQRASLAQGNIAAEDSSYAAIVAEVNRIVTKATSTAEKASKTAIERVTTSFTSKNTGAVNVTYASSQTAIIASIVAILIIVLIMVIIYLILRYRRKKKMKKKLAYIKLIKE
ncbi:hypothetical protein PFDG_00090 [Plasmodium falciparum Dd2]|uniref:Rifin n=1 Tax=Plasmodium falciparum (isolate Dd2) TaxID=57267 RepID=A0A0L7LVU1_PLAF4|nr:hypothetical protein PFDG_00090 [Plasmodium falciparum Dd2]